MVGNYAEFSAPLRRWRDIARVHTELAGRPAAWHRMSPADGQSIVLFA